MPALRDRLPPVDCSKPERDVLLLPSGFASPERTHLGLEDLASIEYRLREGQAHDALHKVRASIKNYNYNLAFKVKYVHGQRGNTRAQTLMKSLAKTKHAAADKYRKARAALISLGLSENDPTLKPLHDSDLWMKDINQPHALGDGTKEEPWFWTTGRPQGMTEAEDIEWSLDGM